MESPIQREATEVMKGELVRRRCSEQAQSGIGFRNTLSSTVTTKASA